MVVQFLIRCGVSEGGWLEKEESSHRWVKGLITEGMMEKEYEPWL